MKVRGRAKVHVILEVDVNVWDETCAIGQIYDQASKEAIDKVIRLFDRKDPEFRSEIRLMPNPKIIAIITEEAS